MDASEAAPQEVGGDASKHHQDGSRGPPIGVVLIAISEIFHPAREDPVDFPAVFEEYAHSNVWTTVHLGEYFGFLFCWAAWSPSTTPSAQVGCGAGLRSSASPLRW